MDWQECNEKLFVKQVNSDQNLISSLINSSNKKAETNNRLNLDETTASTKVSIIYESLREILEAIAIKRGFKIYNHECFCSFLDEICNDKTSSLEFDRFRKIRNKINYYGEDIPTKDTKLIIQEIIRLKERLINKYLKD